MNFRVRVSICVPELSKSIKVQNKVEISLRVKHINLYLCFYVTFSILSSSNTVRSISDMCR